MIPIVAMDWLESCIVTTVKLLPCSQLIVAYGYKLYSILSLYFHYICLVISDVITAKYSKSRQHNNQPPLPELVTFPIRCLYKLYRSLINTNDDSNALFCEFCHCLFSGQFQPLALDPNELKFTRAFLPFPSRVLLSILRSFNNLEFLKQSGLLPLSVCSIRFNYIDSVFVNMLNRRDAAWHDGALQIISIAVGYDTRAYRFAAMRKHKGVGRVAYTSVVEIDQEFVQRRKLELMERSFKAEQLAEMTENVVYIPCTVDDQVALELALQHKSIDPNLNTLFIIAGLSPYISWATMGRTAETLRSFRSRAADKSTHHYVMFDFLTTEKLQEISKMPPLSFDQVLVRKIFGKPEVSFSNKEEILKQEMSGLNFNLLETTDYQPLIRDAIKNYEDQIDINEFAHGLPSIWRWAQCEILPKK